MASTSNITFETSAVCPEQAQDSYDQNDEGQSRANRHVESCVYARGRPLLVVRQSLCCCRRQRTCTGTRRIHQLFAAIGVDYPECPVTISFLTQADGFVSFGQLRLRERFELRFQSSFIRKPRCQFSTQSKKKSWQLLYSIVVSLEVRGIPGKQVSALPRLDMAETEQDIGNICL